MILVVDSNRFIAALIKDSYSRGIFMSGKFDLISINFSKIEIVKYKDEIIKKARVTEHELERLIEILFNKTTVLDDSVIEMYMDEAGAIMDKIDPSDTPFIAVALACNCAIWSDDIHFQKQKRVKIYRTKELIEFMERDTSDKSLHKARERAFSELE